MREVVLAVCEVCSLLWCVYTVLWFSMRLMRGHSTLISSWDFSVRSVYTGSLWGKGSGRGPLVMVSLLLLQIMKKREDLRLIVSSATLDAEVHTHT